MAAEVSRKLRKRIVKSFMDIIILSKLGNNNPISGYDIIAFIHNKFGFLISSGTIYSVLYSLERDGLIEGQWNQRKRVYTLTHRGEDTIKLLQQSSDKIPIFVMDIFGGKGTRKWSPSAC